jgi:predicted dehydrogenase
VVEELQAGPKSGSRCAVYEDFRVMFEREKSIDAVLCATPDHLHAGVAIRAMRAGKHVYCEKPLTHNIREARLIARLAGETGVATQMGNHGHSTVGIRETVEHIQAGTIGAVRQIHAWSNTRRTNVTLTGLPPGNPPLPAGMNWDLWLGPREPRAYHSAYHPVGWRDFWAFGGGAIGDMGCHDLDAATWACELQAPTSVEASPAGPTDAEIVPHGSTIHYDFPARNGRPAVRVTWYDGGLMPPTPAILGTFALPPRGVLFVGDKGAIQCDGAGGAPRLFPESLRKIAKPPPVLARSQGHHRDWLDACKGGPPASSHFGYGARLTEIVLLGVLALRLRHRIAWNADGMCTQPGLDAANAIINGTYRAGWEAV